MTIKQFFLNAFLRWQENKDSKEDKNEAKAANLRSNKGQSWRQKAKPRTSPSLIEECLRKPGSLRTTF